MMKLNYKDTIDELGNLVEQFNKTDDPTERYALIQAINHLAENHVSLHGYWEDYYKKEMIKEKCSKIKNPI